MKTTCFRSTILGIIFAIVLSANPFSARADMLTGNFFGVNADFQDVFFGDYKGRRGDIEGHAAIKGNMDVYNYGIGNGQQNLHTGKTVLVVGGNVKSSGADAFDGNAYIGGTITTYKVGESIYKKDGVTLYKDATAPNGKVTVAYPFEAAGTGGYNTLDPNYKGTPGKVYTNYDVSSVYNFDAAEAQLRQLSASLGALTDNVSGKVTTQNYQGQTYANLNLDLTKQQGLNVITLDVSLLNQLYWGSFAIQALADTTLLINVTDTTGIGYLNLAAMMINGNDQMEQDKLFYDFDGRHILFNIQDSLQVNANSTDIYASFIAVDSDFTVTDGHISGQVFGRSAYTEGGGEFHAYYTFDDRHLPETSPTTPEPASMLIFGIGMVGGAFAAYRRKRVAK